MKMKEIFSKLDSDDMACAILFLTDLTIHILNYSISHEATSGGNVLQVIVIPIEGPQGEEDISDDEEESMIITRLSLVVKMMTIAIMIVMAMEIVRTNMMTKQ